MKAAAELRGALYGTRRWFVCGAVTSFRDSGARYIVGVPLRGVFIRGVTARVFFNKLYTDSKYDVIRVAS